MNNFLVAIGLINLSCTFAVINMVRPRDPDPVSPTSHVVVFIEDDKVVTTLNDRAASGWELVTCRRANSGGGDYANYGYECVLRHHAPAGSVDR